MSWHFSQALEEEFLGENSWDGKQSALLKSTPLIALAEEKDIPVFVKDNYGYPDRIKEMP